MISFIIPVRDRGIKRIQNCVNSLSSDITGEIIIVDYGSKKPICDINGARIIRYDKNEIWNKAHAINLGIRNSKFEYIGTVDCDMIINKSFFEGIKQHLCDKSFIYTLNVKRIAQDDVSTDFKAMSVSSLPWNENQNRYSIIHNANGGIQIYPKKWIVEIGGTDESLVYWGGMDNDVFERAILSGMHTINLNDLILHQEHIVKKEAHLSGIEKIMALKIKIKKAEYLQEMFSERKYIRNSTYNWGLEEPNQKRFLMNIEEMEIEDKREEKEQEKYNSAMINAIKNKKPHFWFNKKKIELFREKTKEEKESERKRMKLEEKKLTEEINYRKLMISAIKQGKKFFLFNNKKVELFK